MSLATAHMIDKVTFWTASGYDASNPYAAQTWSAPQTIQCEYMAGGSVTVLGRTGYNFGAGMTGGFAFVLDEDNDFFDRINPELIELHRISSEATESHRSHLRGVIGEFVKETGSEWGEYLLDNFDAMSRKFWLVKPKAANLAGLLASTRANPA